MRLWPQLALLVLLGLHALLAGRWWPWTLTAALPSDAYLWLLLLVLAWTVWSRQWWGLLLLALAAPLALAFSDLNLSVLTREPAPVLGTRVSVFSWNTEFWDDDRAGLYAFLRAQDADAYLLQERLTRAHLPVRDRAELQAAFPGYSVVEQGELVTLTRLPVLRSSPVPGATVLRVDVAVGGGELSLYNAHIPIFMDGGVGGIPLNPLPAIERRFALREAEFTALQAELDASTRTHLVAGDFNTSLPMRQMDALLATHTDAAFARGPLTPATWHDGLRLWRIDYALASPDLQVAEYREVDPQGRSDHWGLRVEVGW